jgi:hypothetical protein
MHGLVRSLGRTRLADNRAACSAALSPHHVGHSPRVSRARPAVVIPSGVSRHIQRNCLIRIVLGEVAVRQSSPRTHLRQEFVNVVVERPRDPIMDGCVRMVIERRCVGPLVVILE